MFARTAKKKGGPDILDRLNEWGPVISRSDGMLFHLVLGDRPLEYPAEKSAGKTAMESAGFWYVHEGNGGSTETVVVIVRRSSGRGIRLLGHLETVADRLAEKLSKQNRLSCLYEFDGRRLHQIAH
jgi:hypothetical protein